MKSWWTTLRKIAFCGCVWGMSGLLSLVVCGNMAWGAPRYTAEVIQMLPHDKTAFTQGLVVHKGKLFESTGRYGRSSVRQIDPITGNKEKEYRLSRDVFGEGLTLYRDRLFQLTWRAGVVFEYRLKDLEPVGEWPLPTQGWGATVFDDMVVVSDGSDTLSFYDPNTFQLMKSIHVHDGDVAVLELNELESFCGYILANVWHKNDIAVIEPQNGQVVAWIDLSFLEGLQPGRRSAEAVLNGIAYDQNHGLLYVTGKLWPQIYVIAVDGLDALTNNQCRTTGNKP
ncbi:glutaminyl-peptide cyclotransferase [Desulfovibrio inopinatus]|uniref:glutaminyl-peptide cyclotransferase n=1 Tax=Desulfovibrio inopinatus TaxID=102109 RepID=UPI0004056E24|nr:glutaminyl-peptide cyclotransferase [Desulfovibrio inopinatus]